MTEDTDLTDFGSSNGESTRTDQAATPQQATEQAGTDNSEAGWWG